MALLRSTYWTAALIVSVTPLAQAQGGTRPSLSFSPPNPGAYFTTDPPASVRKLGSYASPDQVTRAFFDDVAPGFLPTHVVRKDSYTDVKSGVSHVYVRQLVHGLEVADGDVNLNIRDGEILSFGSSVSLT